MLTAPSGYLGHANQVENMDRTLEAVLYEKLELSLHAFLALR